MSPRVRLRVILLLAGLGGLIAAALGSALLVLLITLMVPAGGCASASGVAENPPAASGSGQPVGASEYGGPGDARSGVVGARGDNLVSHPDTYAELGGLTWQSATAMGGLAYMTPLRIAWAGHSAIAYKRDFGYGGGPVDGLPRVIDLWWQFARRLGIPYESGRWSGAVRIGKAPTAGAANLLGQTESGVDPLNASSDPAACAPGSMTAVALTPGARARLLPGGLAAAPADSPSAVKQIIAAGNQIVGKPYVYGAAHGLPLSLLAPAYDCSSSVEHLLYGARLLPVSYAAASAALESFGDPGPGQWVTLYASADHVFMYVAGLRWDTHNAAGTSDGSAGIGWHPLVRSGAGFVARHPVGL